MTKDIPLNRHITNLISRSLHILREDISQDAASNRHELLEACDDIALMQWRSFSPRLQLIMEGTPKNALPIPYKQVIEMLSEEVAAFFRRITAGEIKVKGKKRQITKLYLANDAFDNKRWCVMNKRSLLVRLSKDGSNTVSKQLFDELVLSNFNTRVSSTIFEKTKLKKSKPGPKINSMRYQNDKHLLRAYKNIKKKNPNLSKHKAVAEMRKDSRLAPYFCKGSDETIGRRLQKHIDNNRT